MPRSRRALVACLVGLAILFLSLGLYLGIGATVRLPWVGFIGGGFLLSAIGLVNWIAARRKERDTPVD
jgi:UPF0716 family protein affecting phage T7 exclusion